MSKPSLLLATPAYGGMFTRQYLESMLETWDWIGAEGIPVATYFIENESLITRARNTCATLALEKGFQKLLFIDADVGWTPEDISRLYYSDKKIIGGLYPHKTYPIKLNWNPKPGAEPDEEGEVLCTHVATGFLMIDLEVLRAVSKVVPHYESSHMSGENRKFSDLFSVGVHNGQYESEDWRFCRLAQEQGYECYANVKSLVTHTGTHMFKAE